MKLWSDPAYRYREARLRRTMIPRGDVAARERATHDLLTEAMRLAEQRGRERRERGEELPGGSLAQGELS